MAKRADTKAAVRAAAKGSGTVFQALEDLPAKPAARRAKAAPAKQSNKAAKPNGSAPRAAAPSPKRNESKPAAAKPAPARTQTTNHKETPEMNATTNFAPTLDIETATANVRQMFDGKTVIERSQKMAQEAAELARGNVEAMVASSRIAAQNATTLSQDVAEVSRKGFEGASEAIKGFAEAKSPTELLRLQGEFAKSYMETMIAESARLSETMVKLAGEAMEPVSSRIAANAEKVKTITSN